MVLSTIRRKKSTMAFDRGSRDLFDKQPIIQIQIQKGLLPQIHQYIQHTYIHTGILQQRGVWKQENAYWSLYGM